MKAVLKSVIPIDQLKYVIEFSSLDDSNMFRAIWATAQEKALKIISSFGIATKRRSMSANAYAWTLMNQLSGKLNKPVLEIYRELIRDIGGSSTVITVRADAAKRFKINWESKGEGWQCLKLDEMATPQGAFYTLQCFYGSSVYDSAQMHRLIELIVQECQQQGIPTMTPEEISKLKGLVDDAPTDTQ